MKPGKYLYLIFFSFSACETGNIEGNNFKEEIRKYCAVKSDQKSCMESIDFVKGRGYCVVKYDKEGCNRCTLQKQDHSMSWFCTSVYCLEKDEEKANKCITYRQALP